MNKVTTIPLKIIIMSCALIANFIFSFSEVAKLSKRLEDIVNNKIQLRYSSDSVMHQEYDYLVYYSYKIIHTEYGHLSVNQWREAYDRAVHTSTIENIIKNYWNHSKKTDYSFYNSINYHIADLFVWLNNELTILYYSGLGDSLFSYFTLQELGNSGENRYFSFYKKVTTTIDNKYVFEMYPLDDDGKAQKEILQALYGILTYDTENEEMDDYYRQYDSAVKKAGHYSVLSWWSAFNARTQKGLTILDVSIPFSWYGSGKPELERMKYLLDIAMHEGKKDISYKELLNTLGSLYSIDDEHRNSVIKKMISDRDHLPFFKNKI